MDESFKTSVEQEATHLRLSSINDISSMGVECANQHSFVCDILMFDISANFLITLIKDSNEIPSKRAKSKCKILKFPSDFKLDEIFSTMSKLKAEEFPNLFIFIIEADNLEKFKSITSVFINFDIKRPIILQITSQQEKITNVFYKDETTENLLMIDQQNSDFENHKDFPTFFMSVMNETIEAFEVSMIDNLLVAKNSCLILKFIRVLQLYNNFIVELILTCGEKGSKYQLLAALDDSFRSEGKSLNNDAQSFLSDSYNVENGMSKSILSEAVKNSNKPIIEFLIETFPHLIRQLQYEHKIYISSIAFDSKQFETLCDLIQYADFPFPKDFTSDSINYERLNKIVDERKKFHEAISKDDMNGVEKFINGNSNLKIVHNIDNKSALLSAVSSKSFKVLLRLKSHEFAATEFENYDKILGEEEMNKVDALAREKMRQNVINALPNKVKSVTFLSNRAYIHNKNLDEDTVIKYHGKINQWFGDIHKSEHGNILIVAAAQCEKLKTIFDFEYNSVANINMKDNLSRGLTDLGYKLIFIGAKLSNEQREQEIKGTLAHELCHYVMKLVFENDECSYYITDADACLRLNEIIKEIDKWSPKKSNNDGDMDEHIDDECNGVISSVFNAYDEDEWHAELIVRVPQILVQFDNDPEQLDLLKQKYKILFDFYIAYVIPKMMKLNLRNRKFNKILGLLPDIEKSGLELEKTKELPLTSNIKVSIIVTNVPRLLLINIYMQSSDELKMPFIDDTHIFITSQNMLNNEIMDEYEHIISGSNKISTIVDFSNELCNGITSLFSNQLQKVIFVARNATICQNVKSHLKQLKVETQQVEVNFTWNDLTLKSQLKLLKIGFTFQNGKATLYSLFSKKDLKGKLRQKQKEDIAIKLDGIIDNELLNSLVERSKFSVNTFFIGELDKDMDFILFCQFRYFIKADAKASGNETQKISNVELIDNGKDQKYVVVSDIAGAGKSWALKSVAKLLIEKFKTSWISYVDLKQFISAFESMTNSTNFLTFMLENVLKDHQKFESNIFKSLYEIGKVFVLFDGFDEISPNHFDTVIRIIKSFESNGGNQMWIATRDYFEVDLKDHLLLDFTYKLSEFTEKDGVDMISSIWVLNDMRSNEKSKIKLDDIKLSPNFKIHQEHAKTLIQNLSKFQFSSIGFPLFYKMAAEVFKNNKHVGQSINMFDVYKKFISIQINRWSHEKGELRQIASTNAHTLPISFKRIHQILAMNILCPEVSASGLEYDEDDWPDTEIIGCGLVTKKEGNFLFIHETFQEFFIADFFVDKLKSVKSNFDFSKTFSKFLTISKYEIVRMFINDALNDVKILRNKNSNPQVISNSIDECISGRENISFVFKENLLNLTELLIIILSNFEYKKVREILNSNTQRIIRAEPKNPIVYCKFQDFFIKFLNNEDLKEFLLKHNIVREMTKSSLESKYILEFLEKIHEKIGFVKELLNEKDTKGRNFFLFLCSKEVNDSEKFEILFDELSQKYLQPAEQVNIIYEKNNNENNILHYIVCSENVDKLNFIWKKLEKIFGHEDFPKNYQKLLKQYKSTGKWNAVQLTSFCKELTFYKHFWNKLMVTLENPHDLKDFLLRRDRSDDNFVHLIARHSTPEMIEFSFKIFKENFCDDEYHEILMSRGSFSGNLLQRAIIWSKNIKTHQVLWNVIQNSSIPSEKLKQFIKEVDDYKINIFCLAVENSTREIFELLIQETEIVLSRDEIRKMLSALKKDRNIFQIVVDYKKSEEFLDILWKNFYKYFDPIEIFQFLIYEHENGRNMMEIAIKYNSLYTVKYIWNEVKMLFNMNDIFTSSSLEDIISHGDSLMKTTDNSDGFNEISKKKFKIVWDEIVSHFNNNYKGSVKISVEKQKALMELIKNQDICNNEPKWQSFVHSFEDLHELKNMIIESKFMPELIINSKVETIKLALQVLKKSLNETQFSEILNLKSDRGFTLLQMFIKKHNNIDCLSIIWNEIRALYCTDNDLLEIFQTLNEDKCNIIQIALKCNTAIAFEFLTNELEKIGTKDEIKIVLSNLDIGNKNIFQIAVEENNTIYLQVSLWRVIHKFYKDFEISELLKHCDNFGRNIMFTLILHSPCNILELFWNKLRHFLTDTELKTIVEHRNNDLETIFHQCIYSESEEKLRFVWSEVEKVLLLQNLPQNLIEILKQKNLYFHMNFLHYAASYDDLKFHEALWELLLKSFENRNDLKEMIKIDDNYGKNLIHHILLYNTPEIVEFTLKLLKEICIDGEYHEILTSKNMLQIAIPWSRWINTHKLVWEVYRNLFESDETFKMFITEVDAEKNNLLHLTVKMSTFEIFEFVMEQYEKVLLEDEIKKLLSAVNSKDYNLLQCAAGSNKSIKLHESLWKTLEKYFNHSEMVELINQHDFVGETILFTCAKCNTTDVADLTWSKIQKFVCGKDRKIYSSIKDLKRNNSNKLTDKKKEFREAGCFLLEDFVLEK